MSSSKSSTILDDLPEDLFAEILCRLPDHKHVVGCKFVSKRWRRLVSFLICDSNFIRRFIRFRHDGKTPIICTLLNHGGNGFRVAKAEELLTTMKMKAEEAITTVTMEVEKLLTRRRTEAGNDQALITTADFTTIMTTTAERSLSPISSKPLTSLFKRLIARMSCYLPEIVSPVVVATYNDLVLCRYKTAVGIDEYHIYNPYTEQSVALPYGPPLYEFRLRSMIVEAVGFICDLDKSGSRCKVVRISGEARQSYSELKVQIFSSETGVWRESIIAFSQQIPGLTFDINVTYPYNGMLYWKADNNTFVGFDPFMINSTSGDGGDTLNHYKGRIIELGDKKNSKSEIEFVGICGGRLRFIDNLDFISYELPVWELEEEEDERAHDRSGKLVLKCTRFSLDREMFRDRDLMYRRATGHEYWLVFDPNDENILYVNNMAHSRLIFRCNIRTTEWSKVPYMSHGRDYVFLLTVLPRWPTPVPRNKNTYVPCAPETYDTMHYFAA